MKFFKRVKPDPKIKKACCRTRSSHVRLCFLDLPSKRLAWVTPEES
jgi:hypothetical protein